jgi:four helix bundle protein
MTGNSKRDDLEDRTLLFAGKVISFINVLPKTLTNIEISKQLVRAVGSVGANYIEANESLSKKDFVMRIKICRKETKETRYWLKLTSCIKGSENERRSLSKNQPSL